MAATVSWSSHDSLMPSVCIAIWMSWASATVSAWSIDARISRVVLVHLEPARARLDLPAQRVGHRARRPAEHAQVDRLVLERQEHPLAG